MDENKIPEATAEETTDTVEETAAAVTEEAADTVEETAAAVTEEAADTVEEAAAAETEEAADTVEEAAAAEAAEAEEDAAGEIAEETNAAEENVEEEIAEADTENESEEAAEASETDGETADAAITEASDDEQPAAKKKGVLQIPVIISLCIVVAALLGYFVFTGFFLREPEGVTWSDEIDGATYYYEFKNDGTFDAYVGSVEIHSTYQKSKAEDGNTITVGSTIGNFYSGAAATYEITGSRLLGNQTLNCKYNDEYQFTVSQASRKENVLELPKDFTPDEELLGSWLFKYMGYDIYKVTFNNDGSMALEFLQDGIKYNGTYTLQDGVVNFTYYVAESYATPLEYSIDGDTLNFMGYTFVREGSEAAEATPDQQLIAAE